ncbi:MAG: T9SS type A sorting domain-containing protein [Brumimicrobium sp.]
MKKTSTKALVLAFSLIIGLQTFSQWEQEFITHDGIERMYWRYVSPNYNAANPASLVVTLHGMGDNATNFKGIEFDNIADTANVIVLAPESLVDGLTGMTAWNSQAGVAGIYPNATINDIGFIHTIIDETMNNYSVNVGKVYACGFSMGGFMTQRLAIEGNTKFTAFASVAGTFGSGLTLANPNRAIPIAHFHGTTDATVGYDSNIFGSNVADLIDFWVDNNNCDITPTQEILPDLVADGFTVEHFVYPNGDDESVVELFKVNDAGHIWLRTGIHDISYSGEIWKFFNRYENPLLSVPTEDAIFKFSIYPNPASEILFVNFDKSIQSPIILLDMNGKEVFKTTSSSTQIEIPVASLDKGIYIIKVGESTRKVIIQ